MRLPEEELAQLKESGLFRSLRHITASTASDLTIEGRELLNFSSNDYLGLSSHPALRTAAQAAIEQWGTGAGASRLICGSLDPSHALEARLAELKKTAAALTFANGYTAAVGSITSLVGTGDTVILDKLSHASLVDGARLSGATLRVFPHNNLEKLARLLESSASTTSRTLVVTESVFSMDGDLAPLLDIIDLKDRFGALLLLDEAHAIGVLGPSGQGLAEELGVQDQVDFQMGTLGKAVGSAGGYLATSQAYVDLMINKARSFIYSTAPPPAQAAASLAGLNLIASAEGTVLRARLQQHIVTVSEKLTLPSRALATPILPLIIGENDHALAASQKLLAAGLLVPAIRYPTVPRKTARLRLTLSAAHQGDQLDQLIKALSLLKKPE